MATSLAGYMYEMVLQRTHQHSDTCIGPDCFRYTFLIVAALSLLSTLLAGILWYRTRTMYATIIEVGPLLLARRGLLLGGIGTSVCSTTAKVCVHALRVERFVCICCR